MTEHLIDPDLASASGPVLVAVQMIQEVPRSTAPHQHARGQLLGAVRGLVTVGTENGRWVVPAIHCVWLPPRHRHSLQSHGPFAGWSIYIEEQACAELPSQPCTMRTSGLLRESVARAATWRLAPLTEAQVHLAAVIFDEIRTLPRERLGLPMPTDQRLLKIAKGVVEDLADNRKLETWAEWAGLSARTVTRRFPVETGFTFTEWRQRARLMHALEMLSANASVTSIAFDLGYETVSAFIALFRRTFGVTPSRYLGM